MTKKVVGRKAPKIKTPKLPYVMKLQKLNRNTIKNFYSDEKWRRKIRKGNVQKFVTLMRQGKHFSSPFVVNEANKSNKIIDGNHRFEAVEQVLAIDKTFSINVWVATYRNLNLQGERDAFADWNVGTKQTSDDFLKIYWDTIPKGKQILENIPTSIYNTPNKLKVKVIVGCCIEDKKQNKFAGGYGAGNVQTVRDFERVSDEDITTMSAFVKDFEEILGRVNTANVYWKTTPVAAFYRLWYDNRTTIPRNKFISLMKTTLFSRKNHQSLIDTGRNGGRAASVFFYNMVYLLLEYRTTKERRYIKYSINKYVPVEKTEIAKNK